MNSQLNWTRFPNPIRKDEIKLELTWHADEYTRAAILRQAAAQGFDSPTEYLKEQLAATLASDEADTVLTDDGRIAWRGEVEDAAGKDA